MRLNFNEIVWAIGLAVLTAIFMAIGFTGCKTCVPIVETRDSIRTVEVHTRDTAFITKADSAQAKLLLRCDSANNVLIDEISAADGERLRLQARIRQLLNGQTELSLDCKEDSLRHVIQLQDSIIKTSVNTHTVQTVEVVPSFYKNCTITMWILVVAIGAYIAIRILAKIYLGI